MVCYVLWYRRVFGTGCWFGFRLIRVGLLFALVWLGFTWYFRDSLVLCGFVVWWFWCLWLDRFDGFIGDLGDNGFLVFRIVFSVLWICGGFVFETFVCLVVMDLLMLVFGGLLVFGFVMYFVLVIYVGLMIACLLRLFSGLGFLGFGFVVLVVYVFEFGRLLLSVWFYWLCWFGLDVCGFSFVLVVVIVLLVTALRCLVIVLIVQYYLKWSVWYLIKWCLFGVVCWLSTAYCLFGLLITWLVCLCWLLWD